MIEKLKNDFLNNIYAGIKKFGGATKEVLKEIVKKWILSPEEQNILEKAINEIPYKAMASETEFEKYLLENDEIKKIINTLKVNSNNIEQLSQTNNKIYKDSQNIENQKANEIKNIVTNEYNEITYGVKEDDKPKKD